jgi:hypothetical protein
MIKFWTWAAIALVGIGLVSCGPVTGLPATGAASSAPGAVDSAKGGYVGGGAPANTNGNVDPQSLKQTP